ncbi:ABC transporter permease [Parafrigoribacterium soli]|uniref:ABC transporter permease n=1 Tax=Parafrigoribacterium soli TaxID=3144663 RepID=UPI0032EFAC19
MNGYGIFARKELSEILRTWRIWVLPAIIVFFALSGPVLARFTPEIIGALAGSQLGHMEIPTPSYLDAYSGWVKNLSQITLFALIIIYGGIVSSETKSGTAILVLTKPVSRSAFVVVKAVVHSVFVAVLVVVGTLLTWAVTAIVFGTAPGGPLWSAAGVWLVYGVLFVALMTLFSVLIPSAAGAAGAGIGAYVLLSIASIWKPLSEYSPAGLPGQAASLAAHTTTPSSLWPVTTSLALWIVLVALAAVLFRRKEL